MLNRDRISGDLFDKLLVSSLKYKIARPITD